jgi:hypothetical protein
MAILGNMYGKAAIHAFSKKIDWVNDNIKVALVKDTYVPNQDEHEYFSSIATNEITGTGYVTGGATLTNKTITYNATTNEVKFDSDDIIWANATLTARYAIIYDSQSGINTTNPLIALVDFGENKSSTNMDFKLTVGADGVFTVSTV